VRRFSAADISRNDAYRLLTSTIVPRPIAFVTTVDPQGRTNAAPFSFFNAVGSAPPTVVLGFEPNADGSQKDTPNNIIATGEFVVNLVDRALAEQMSAAAASLPQGQSEIDHVGLDIVPSVTVTPPRLAASPVAMECRLTHDNPLSGGGRVILGEVVEFHIRDALIESLDPLRIDLDQLDAISRLSGPDYGTIKDRFSIQRPA
jgi:flavin reductase (DIM6/NTAB) family NADH-FMN oxidoreductase RutF